MPVPEVPDTFAVNIVPFALSVEPAVVKSLLPVSKIIYSVPLTMFVAGTSTYCNASKSARDISALLELNMLANSKEAFAVIVIV